jgi:hypothetical protein
MALEDFPDHPTHFIPSNWPPRGYELIDPDDFDDEDGAEEECDLDD